MKHHHKELFTLSQQQEATFAMICTGWHWNLFLRRHLNDWEMGRVAELFNPVAGLNNLSGGEDRQEWIKDRSGKFCQLSIQGAEFDSDEGKRLA